MTGIVGEVAAEKAAVAALVVGVGLTSGDY